MRILPLAIASAAALAGSAVVATPASARTFVSVGIGAPVYPAYYGGYYPAYYGGYYAPPVVYGGYYGGWHRPYYRGYYGRGYYGRGWHGGYHGRRWR
jgi:hypothetical protein